MTLEGTAKAQQPAAVLSKALLVSSNQDRDNCLYYTLPTASHGNEVLGGPPRRRTCKLQLFMVTTLAFFASIAGLFALTAFCKKAHSKVTEPGMAGRRLAGAEGDERSSDQEMQKIVALCGPLEDTFEGSSGTAAESWSEALGPREKKARIEQWIYETACAFERSVLVPPKGNLAPTQSPFLGGTNLPRSSCYWGPRSSEERHDQLPSKGPQRQHDSELSESAESLRVFLESAERRQASLDLDPWAWLDSIPDISEELEGKGEAAPEAGEAVDDTQPSTSTAALAGLWAGGASYGSPEDFDTHPFVRLPIVNPLLLKNRRPLRESPFLFRWFAHSASELYNQLRLLFLKPSLTARDVGSLVLKLKGLANFLVDHSKSLRLLQPYQLAELLGTLFLGFDFLVCGIKLLGETVEDLPWWGEFVSSIETDFNAVYDKSANIPLKTQYNREVAHRASGALADYKRGHRPCLSEVIKLKQMLLCSNLSPRLFKGSRWDAWREDDKRFRDAHREPSADSGNNEQGESPRLLK